MYQLYHSLNPDPYNPLATLVSPGEWAAGSITEAEVDGLPVNGRGVAKFLRRRVGSIVFPILVETIIRLLWKTCRITHVIGSEHIENLMNEKQTFIPCYWHQQQIFCLRYLLDLRDSGLKLGYLISPSADGDVASKMFGDLGLHIIRGSATRSGAQALREIYTVIKKDGISPIITPDGPTGPIFEFKQGVAMLSHLSGAPLVPIAYSASHYWQLTSWDKFIVPRPFARIVIGIGTPLLPDRKLPLDELPHVCAQMTEQMNELVAQAEGIARSA